MKKFLIAMACIFAILTIVFYVSSLNHLDRDSARLLGTDTVVNIQATVFCAACAVICALNVIGALILTYLESNMNSSHSSIPNNTNYSAINSLVSDKERRVTQETEEARKQRILKEGGWKCICGNANYAYVSTCACGRNKREVLAFNHEQATSAEAPKPQNIKKSENPDWIDDGNGFVNCPQCGNHMTIDFIEARKKCPDCGCTYRK